MYSLEFKNENDVKLDISFISNMDNIKEKFGGGKPTYQQEQAKLRSEEREKEDKKLRRKKRIKDRRAGERQKFNETLAKLPVKVKEVHLEGITGTKDILVKNILSDVLKVQNILLLSFFVSIS